MSRSSTFVAAPGPSPGRSSARYAGARHAVRAWLGRKPGAVPGARARGRRARLRCLTFDLGGHAGTQPQRETVTRGSNLYDLLAAYDHLAAHPCVDNAAIAVVGRATAATWRGSWRRCGRCRGSGCALPRSTRRRLGAAQAAAEPDHELARTAAASSRQDNRALSACSTFRGDVLLLESEHDDFVPPAVIKNYLAAFANPRSLTSRLMQGADHGVSDENTSATTPGCSCSGSPRCSRMHAVNAAARPQSRRSPAMPRGDAAVEQAEPEAPPKAS